MKVSFVRVKKPEKARHLCELAEHFQQQGARVYITVADENQGITLDQFMWHWKKGSFLPHVYDNGAVECHEEPVVIGTHERNPNSAGVLVMGHPCSIEFIRHFGQAIDFAELHDPELAEQSRARFALYRKAGFETGMFE
jgi:DNA polymerase III subunit chi